MGNPGSYSRSNNYSYGTTSYNNLGGGADVGNQYSAPDFHNHITGYDAVKPLSFDEWQGIAAA